MTSHAILNKFNPILNPHRSLKDNYWEVVLYLLPSFNFRAQANFSSPITFEINNPVTSIFVNVWCKVAPDRARVGEPPARLGQGILNQLGKVRFDGVEITRTDITVMYFPNDRLTCSNFNLSFNVLD